MENFIVLNQSNIENEHICCGFSDKKCKEGYELKKDWLKCEFEKGYVFRRLDERAKVFMEYCPSEFAWAPIEAPNYLVINCFWVSGKYKGKGYAKELLKFAIEEAESQGKFGLVTVVGTKKFHFMSDTNWFLRQGFETSDKTSNGFSLLVKKFDSKSPNPIFKNSVKVSEIQNKNGLIVYYSNRCPFTEFYVQTVLKETAKKRNLPLEIIKLDTMEKAQAAPSPATIFSLFYNGDFITTDLSICLDNHFDKFFKK